MRMIDNLLEQIFSDYSDVDVNTNQCIDLYQKESQCSDFFVEFLKSYCHILGAYESGIPLSVINGSKKLTDVFSKEYIEYCTNKRLIDEINKE